MAGPAIRICPECGKVMGRDRMFIRETGKLYILPLPAICPDCDTVLVTRSRFISSRQMCWEKCP